MVTKVAYWDQITEIIKIINEIFKFSNSNTENYIDLEEALLSGLTGDHLDQTRTALRSLRSSIVQAANTNSRALLDPIIRELAFYHYDSNTDLTDAALAALIKGMSDGSETILSRGYTHDSSFSFSGVGSGEIYRSKLDEYGNTLEIGEKGDFKLICTRDKNNGGIEGSEEFVFRGDGTDKPQDEIDVGDEPSVIVSLTATNYASSSYVTNASFEQNSGTGASFTLTGWTLGTPANLQENTTNTYSSLSSSSLEFLDNTYIKQDIVLDDFANPYFVIIPYMRKTSCDGTLTITLGSKSVTKDISTAVNDTWEFLVMGIEDTKTFYNNWKQEDNSFKIDLSSRTTGTLIIDDVIFSIPVFINGSFWLIMAGPTPYISDDEFSGTDTTTDTGIIQNTMQRLFGISLPHTSGTPTYADPT